MLPTLRVCPAALQFISTQEMNIPGLKQISPCRHFVAAAATGLATLGVLGASATTASAEQGNMEHALSALFQAVGALRQATPNKGGHRERAMDLISRPSTRCSKASNSLIGAIKEQGGRLPTSCARRLLRQSVSR